MSVTLKSWKRIWTCLVVYFEHTFEYFKPHFTHFYTFLHSRIIKNTQITLLKLLYQTPSIFQNDGDYMIRVYVCVGKGEKLYSQTLTPNDSKEWKFERANSIVFLFRERVRAYSWIRKKRISSSRNGPLNKRNMIEALNQSHNHYIWLCQST